MVDLYLEKHAERNFEGKMDIESESLNLLKFYILFVESHW